MRLFDRLRSAAPVERVEERQLLDLYETWRHPKSERAMTDFRSYVEDGYFNNGVVFAIILARLSLFSAIEFKFQQLNEKRELFGTPELSLLERPWPNGTTGELLARMEQDVSLAGNAYVHKAEPGRLQRLRPDWVEIITDGRQVAGYLYTPGGPHGGENAALIMPEDMAHWSPIPDPLANFRGMSWLTPVVREVNADTAMTSHKGKFFENAATPNLLVVLKQRLKDTERERLQEMFSRRHEGLDNAYRTMFVEGGADVSVIGNSFEQMNFTSVQAAGENRITAAAGVPGIVVGLKEGLSAATYSNYAQAMRRWVDISMHPYWQSVCSALSSLVNVPQGSRLWYDYRNIPALRQDAKDAADIAFMKAQAVEKLVTVGFNAEDVARWVDTGEGLSAITFEGPPEPAVPPAVPPTADPADTQD